MKIKFKTIAAVAAFLVFAVVMPRPGHGAAVSNPAVGETVVLELFMSQGCSSCPPAVALLTELERDTNVIALTWPVDYWDYAGWKDTFAQPQNSERQRAYNDHLGLRFLYTPQMFVNGAAQTVGSDRAEVIEALRDPAKRLRLPVEIRREGDQVIIALPEAPASVAATVWLVRYDRNKSVKIAAGENSGKTMSIPNVVRDSTSIGTWNGGALEIALAVSDLIDGDREACAIIIQTAGTGPIIGAATLDLVSLTES